MAVPIDTRHPASIAHFEETGRYLLVDRLDEHGLSRDTLARIARASRRWNDPKVQKRAEWHRKRLARIEAEKARARAEQAGVSRIVEQVHGGAAA